jgi:hypothetical protein
MVASDLEGWGALSAQHAQLMMLVDVIDIGRLTKHSGKRVGIFLGPDTNTNKSEIFT